MKRRTQAEEATRQARALVSPAANLSKSLSSVSMKDEHYGSMGRGKQRTSHDGGAAQQEWDESIEAAVAQHDGRHPQRKRKTKSR
jgi:hypothetical protein